MAEGQEITIQTRLGPQTIGRERILRFPKGLIGFPEKHEFTLFQIGPESPFMMLQSLEDADFGLVVTDPYAFVEHYELHVGDVEQRILGITDPKELAILVTVTIPRGRPQDTTLNLTGPILINVAQRLGLQVPQTDPRFPSHYSLSAQDQNQGEGDAG